MDVDAPPEPLQYAAAPAWHRRRRWRAAALLAILVVLGAAGVYSWRRWGPRIQARWQMLSAQRACLRHDAPDDAVVFYQDATVTYAGKPWMRRQRRFEIRHPGGVAGLPPEVSRTI